MPFGVGGNAAVSDYEVKIIPVDPFFSVSEREAQKVVRLLERKVKAGWVEMNMRKQKHKKAAVGLEASRPTAF